jgi:glucose 1-dehydrogenase
MMMQSIAQEVAPHRMRVNSIAPGAIRTLDQQEDNHEP